MATIARCVLVSGAGGALGSAFVSHYASRGRTVLAVDTELARLDPISATCLHKRQLNVLLDQEFEAALDQFTAVHGPTSLLVNAVGRIWNEPVLSLRGAKITTHSLASWSEALAANLTAAFTVASRVGAHMARNGGGSIVNFSSIAADGVAGQTAYSAAKAGVEGMTRAMASELGPLGVRVNALAPGFIDVETTRNALSERARQEYAERTPLRRFGHIQDVIGAVEFLETNEFVNGAILKIDGGLRV